MKHFAWATCLVLLLLPVAFAQAKSEETTVSPCTLTVAQSPVVRGVKLGMSTHELFELFPGSAENNDIKRVTTTADDYPQFGVVQFTIYPLTYVNKDRFTGIEYFDFTLLDGHVARFYVQYKGLPDGPRWGEVDDFIAKLDEALKIPAARDWATYQGITTRKNIKCNGFEMMASVSESGSLMVWIQDPYQKRQERRKAYEEKMRREFKP